jgi:hypothetical protein
MLGKIERKSFHFIADNCKIWHKGICIANIDSIFKIEAVVNSFNGKIEVTIDNSKISDYIIDSFSFAEISLMHDRVLWSNNILNAGAGCDDYEPSIMSLFYFKGMLSKIYLNVYKPSAVLIELVSNQEGKIEDIETPLKKILKEIAESTQENKNQVDLSNITFVSNSHQRYENGIPVMGLQECRRAIKIEENVNGCEGYNIKGGDGYIVTIFNLEGIHPIWKNNIQMSPKPMRVISKSLEKIVLRGYRVKVMTPDGWMDFNGADYGLSIFIKNGEIEYCIAHMHDRNIDIKYFK